MKRKKVKTEDGSHSFFVESLDEYYHSIYGSIQESQHVFVDAGLKYFKQGSQSNILEIGFGTGLNALMTIIENEKRKCEIHYTAVEAFPLTDKETHDLNYTDKIGQSAYQPTFKLLHDSNWGNPIPITKDFTLQKLKLKLKTFLPNQILLT